MRVRTPSNAKRSIAALETLIFDADTEEPPVLDEEDRKYVHIAVRIAVQSDIAFRRLLRRRDPLARTDYTEDLCIDIRSGMDFYASLMSLTGYLRGATAPRRPTGSLRQVMIAHGKTLRRLAGSNADLPGLMSLLVELIQLELVWFASSWPTHVMLGPESK